MRTYLNDPVTVDLVGEANSGRMAESITALAVQASAPGRGAGRAAGPGGRPGPRCVAGDGQAPLPCLPRAGPCPIPPALTPFPFPLAPPPPGPQVTDAARRPVLVDLLTVYGAGGKSIVFTQTKREADEVAAAVGGHLPCAALHGDMGQREREKVLQGFRDNKLLVLVATDVAAR